MFIYLFRFPFDWKNPRGYLIALILTYLLHRNLVYFLVCMLNNGIGGFMLTISLTKEIKTDLSSFSTLVKSDPNPMMYFKPLYDLIDFHSTLKRCARAKKNSNFIVCQKTNSFNCIQTINILCRYFSNVSKIFEPILMTLIAANFITLCVAMLSMKIGMVRIRRKAHSFFEEKLQVFSISNILSSNCSLTMIC